ncbi:MAG: long-chain fatty acid--CoA ligase [Desulfarculus sp.]|nr:long-chain fatty acid--CoA ligase [Pseudomonadota bacterium]MBV1716028.1 long-chain fatty acid--CoA ligase [Desulfarculus sp.]MBU4575169.1 long-chain fatty acid--CoA ligase [Pseudomonadota bacterium]MBU4596612.1 long-chain fatty acid--CoA ligase [Pseudomonadota bacterium]MBV1738465.1 long-chain fatty acid--CoA ligase [Desulfarculus sp.]
MNMGDMLRRTAGRVPDKPALIMGEASLTYGELNRRVNRLANAFMGRGLVKGDRVAVLTNNCIEFFEIYLALCKSGGVLVPINNLLRLGELNQIMAYMKPRFIVYHKDFQELVLEVMDRHPSLESAVCLGGEPAPGHLEYEALMDNGSEAEPRVEIRGEDLMSIFLTSGTTGRPKGALRTHHHNCLNAMSAAIEVGVRPDDRVLLLFPFYHVTFEDRFCHLMLGNTFVLRREGSFDPAQVLDLLSKHRITICQFVPTMISSMLENKDIETYDLSALRLILYAAAPMPVELLKKAMGRFKCGFMQFYGQTETGPMTTILRPEDHILEGAPKEVERLASCGRPVLMYEAMVVDETGKEVAPGQVGELVVRSESTAGGYWALPEESGATMKEGWLHTGDFARRDEEGFIFIVDRKGDMIISGGKNIYPREIEEVLYQHPQVREAMVIGVPDPHWGESVKAIVVLKNGVKVEAQEIIEHCKKNLASYKKPKTVEFWDSLPKSPTGKLLKRVVRDKFLQPN